MPVTRPTISQLNTRIENDIVSRISGSKAVASRGLVRVLARVLAGLFHILWGRLEWQGKQMFVQTSDASYLDRHGYVRSITRKQATYATGPITITGDEGESVPAGTIWQREDGVRYTTDELATLPAGGSIEVNVTAQVAGTNGNTAGGGSLTILTPIAGVDSSATIGSEGLTGGTAAETDTAYKTRMAALDRARRLGGSDTDYEIWAEEVAGVAKAWCYPLFDGAGTVGLSVLADGDDPIPSAALLDAVEAYVGASNRKPSAAQLIMIEPERVSVQFTLGISPNNTTTRDLITSNLKDLMLEKIYPGGSFAISLVHNALQRSNVTLYDISSMSVDTGEGYEAVSPPADVELTGGQYAVLDAITFTSV
ncbi:baseplate J/gp47 family protein [bacterium]|nr:baseplate J/gp47 family protein [bacterium]